jgi:hypothetical protein
VFRIYKPRPTIRSEQRAPECQAAMEPALWQVIDRAKLAGWTGEEAFQAALVVIAQLAEEEQRSASRKLHVGHAPRGRLDRPGVGPEHLDDAEPGSFASPAVGCW